MEGRGFRVTRARWWCAAAASALLPGPLLAQPAPAPAPVQPPPDAAELDPNAPLDPLPGLGVAWPTLDAKDTAPAPVQATSKQRRQLPSGDMRYTVAVEGLGPIGDADELLRAFRQQSALEAERKDAANAAQIGRRLFTDYLLPFEVTSLLILIALMGAVVFAKKDL